MRLAFRNGGRCRCRRPSLTTCKRLLSRVPTVIEHIDKKLSSTLQFINVAINPASDCEVMGGTQDNGTWSNNDRTATTRRGTQVIYGDGGNAGYDATNPTWRFNEFTGGFSDSNFRNGDPEKWVITSAPVVEQRRSRPAFYWPQIGDPNPAPGTHPIYSGATARLADVGLRRRAPGARAAGQDAEHRRLRGQLSRVRHLRRPARLR